MSPPQVSAERADRAQNTAVKQGYGAKNTSMSELQNNAENLFEGGTRENDRYIKHKFNNMMDQWQYEPDKFSISKDDRKQFRKKLCSGRNLIHFIMDVVIDELSGSHKNESPSQTENGKNPWSTYLVKPEDFVEPLVIMEPNFFVATTTATNDEIPLIRATKIQISILSRVLNLIIPDHVQNSILFKCMPDQKTCPLQQVAKGLLDVCTKGTPAMNGVTVHKATNTLACLHENIDTDALLKKSKDIEKSLRGFFENRVEQKNFFEALFVEGNFDPGTNKTENQCIQIDEFKTILRLFPSDAFASPLLISNNSGEKSYYVPLHEAVRLYAKGQLDYTLLLDVIKCLVDQCPASIFLESKGKNVYWLLQDTRPPSSSSNARTDSWNKAGEFLKRACIGSSPEGRDGNTPSDVKVEFLYRDREKARKFHINLVGVNDIIDKTYIDSLGEWPKEGFETALEFVNLPYWKPESTSDSTEEETISQPSSNSLAEHNAVSHAPTFTPYEALFDWLWNDRGVRKIFTVNVIDDGPQSHTNAALLRIFCCDSRGGFDVEVWNWKKYDICAEVVAKAAPSAHTIHLYSRGNVAVLRGWANSPGLAKMQNLKTVFVTVDPENVDDEKDCTEYNPIFQKTLIQNCPALDKNIKMTIHHFQHEDETGNKRENVEKAQSKISSPNEWVENMAGFRSFIRNLPFGSKKKPHVKIAVLDDGFSRAELNNIKTGVTFHAKQVDFFVGSCEHGTSMIQCIRKVCPMATLYVARLDDSGDAINQTFTLASCYKALKWAIDINVDIVSMSWTFQKGENDKFQERFIDLIDHNKDRILFFGSLPNPGIKHPNPLPAYRHGVIKISATSQKDSNTELNPDFLLPGDNREINNSESCNSFATAYASGLAALVLYCIRSNIVLKEGTKKTDSNPLKPEHMPKILSNFCKNGITVEPPHSFQGCFPTSQQDMIDTLSKICSEIQPYS